MPPQSSDKTGEDRPVRQVESVPPVGIDSRQAVVVISVDGTVEYWNAGAERLYGWKREEVLNRPMNEVIVPHASEDKAREVMRQLMHGQRWSGEFELKRKDGTSFSAHVVDSPIMDGEGKLVGIIGITTELNGGRERDEDDARNAALFRNEAAFIEVARTSSELVMLLDERGRITYQSPSIKRVLGHDRMPLDREVFELIHPEDRPRAVEALREILQGATEVRLMSRVAASSGEWRWVDSTAVNRLNDPFLRQIVVNSRDVTDEIRQRDSLAHRDRLLETAATVGQILSSGSDFADAMRLAFEQIGIATGADRVSLFEVHGEGLVSQRFEWTNGTVNAEIDNPDLQNVPFSIDFADWALQLSQGDWCGGLVRDMSDTARGYLESQGIRSLLLVPIMVDGAWDGFIALDDCYTEREWAEPEVKVLTTIAAIVGGMFRKAKAESRLMASEERLLVAMDATSLGMWDLNVDTGEITWSDRAAPILGGSREALQQGVRFEDFVLEEDWAMLSGKIAAALNEGRPLAAEYRIRRPDGTTRWVRSGARPTTDEAGKVIRLIGTLLDISDTKDHEADLIAARERAEEMMRLKDAFLSNMSHEIRTPLASIIGFSEVLVEETEGELLEIAGMIRNGGERLMLTLSSVLDLAQLESGSMKLCPGSLDLSAELSDIVDLFTPVAEKKGLSLRYVSQVFSLPAYLDKGALTRVLSNLISNGIKFTDAGSVVVSLMRDGNHALIKVSDTGIGIDPAFTARMYTPFAQESSGLGRGYEGSGLGLAITRKLVSLLGGTIEVNSRKGHGTTFSVRIPRNAVELVGRHPKVDRTETENLRVMVLEDHPDTRKLFSQLLKTNHSVQCFSTAEEALGALATESFDLFIIDVHLGEGLSGTEFLQSLRSDSRFAAVPAIACTGYALPGDRGRFMQAGFQGYLAKPFRRDSLMKAIEDAVRPSADTPSAWEGTIR
jgi:PAS domain S-box-containing protein